MHLLSQLLLATTCINFVSSFSTPPSWDQLNANPSLSKPSPPIYHDALPDDIKEKTQRPILYRDKDCICAASQSVWLALECKNIDYLTVLVSKDEDELVPRIVWPGDNDDSNVETTDAIKILEEIQKRYAEKDPQFYPKLSAAVDAARCNIMRLPGVMPRNSDPAFMDLAPYMFKEDGTMVIRSSHCVSIEEVDEMQEEYYLGNYLCGKEVTATDMIWAPYLERYAIQLPLLFPNDKRCNPRSSTYEEVAKWYASMERQLPAYSCCVQGDERHWRRCLEKAVTIHNNERAVSNDQKAVLPPVPEKFGWWMKKNPKADKLWEEYSSSRPWLGDSPLEEVALYLIRNQHDLIAAVVSSLDMKQDSADEALREVIQLLLSDSSESSSEVEQLSDKARQVAMFVSDTIQVPKNLAYIPALALGQLVKSIIRVESSLLVQS